VIRFDAYTATTEALKPSDVLPWLLRFAGDTLHQGKGFHTFGERIAVRDETGSEVGAVAYGGKQGDRIMVEVKGERTPELVERLRSAAAHRCTRVDACADFDAPGAFSRLLRHCRAVKKGHHLWGDRRGDWEDHPERGRTQYLGATSSPVRARLYEKGLQPEYLHLAKPDWVRLELQVRPAKEAKEAFAKLSAVEVWGASKWSRDLAALALQEHVDPHPAGTVYRLTSQDHKLRWMCRQYGGALMQLAEDCGGWDVAGLTLREVLAEVQRDDKRTRR
jgi:DNA relaxase NicK